MIIVSKFDGYTRDGIRRLYMGGGGGGGQTTSTVQNTNIPEYARPYVETMLGATQEQLFQGNRTPVTTDPNTGETTGGDFNITGFKPYQAYGGQYDAQGNPVLGPDGKPIYDAGKAIAGFQPMQETAQKGIAGLQMPGEFGQASGITQAAAQNAQNMGYRGEYAGNQFQAPGQFNAPQLNQYQMGPAERVNTKSFTDAGTADAYMSPYMQKVVGMQQREATRASEIQRNQNQAQAVGQGAFGGSRQAIIEAERQRNLGTQLGDIQATGSQAAFQQAQQQFNAEQGIGLQGQMANQGAGLTVGQQNLAAQLGIQQLGEQSRQFGAAQGMTAAQQRAQYGLAANQLNAQQQQFGATYGQNANAQALAAANQLAGIGQQGLTAQQGIYGLQNQVGAQQQGLEQQKINQAMQDYANAQQYPLMQLGTMSNMLRGLPMQAATTNQYQAAPNQLSQAIGTIGAGTSIFNAMKPGGAAGGLPSEFKYAKGGGIMSYDMGGEVEEQLESMDEKGLAAQAKESSSPSIRKMAQRLLRERQMSKQPQGTGPMGVQYQAPMPAMRAGGIIAFKTGGGANEEGGEEEARIGMEERLATPPTMGGIMGAAPVAPAAPPPPTAGQAVQRNAALPEFMRADYEAAEKRAAAPLSDFMAERRTAMQEAGVADMAEGQQKQRAELMAEKAGMKEEKDRQKYMRLAEFFAAWGSTPGPTLVAGLNALQKTVPNIISDEKEQKKAQREINKSIADLDNATRLEKRGEVDAAMQLKLKAAEDMKKLNEKFIEYQSQRARDEAQAKTSKYSVDTQAGTSRYVADTQFRSEQLRANTSRLDRLASRATADDNKAFGQYQTAVNQEQRVIAKIIDQAKLLEKDYETIKTAETQAAAKDGAMDPRLVPGYEAAKKKIADQEAVWNKQKEAAARDTELAYSRVRIKPEAAPAAAGSPTPAPAGGLETGDFPAPTAAHIAALKANPSQREAFDKKFGPGAANEYSGK
jgi:hypothetical protein